MFPHSGCAACDVGTAQGPGIGDRRPEPGPDGAPGSSSPMNLVDRPALLRPISTIRLSPLHSIDGGVPTAESGAAGGKGGAFGELVFFVLSCLFSGG